MAEVAVWQWNPRSVIGGMVAVAELRKPTSEYGEEIACCLSLAQEAREQGAVQMLTPAVVSLRKTKLVVVIADMREERVLERVAANVLALLQGNSIVTERLGGDLTSMWRGVILLRRRSGWGSRNLSRNRQNNGSIVSGW